MHWLLVVWTIVTVYCTVYLINTNAMTTLYSLSCTQLLDSSCKIGSLTIPRQHLARDDLHWLPVSQRISYKLCTIVYKCLHQFAPEYIRELCVLPVTNTASGRYLHSAVRGDLQNSNSWTVTYGPSASLRTPPNSGTAFQLHFDTRYWRLYSFVTSCQLTCLV